MPYYIEACLLRSPYILFVWIGPLQGGEGVEQVSLRGREGALHSLLYSRSIYTVYRTGSVAINTRGFHYTV